MGRSGSTAGAVNADSCAATVCSVISDHVLGGGESQGGQGVTDQTPAHGRGRAKCLGDARMIEIYHVLQDHGMALALRQICDMGPQVLVRALPVRSPHRIALTRTCGPMSQICRSANAMPWS